MRTFRHLAGEHAVEDRAVGRQNCPVHRNAVALHHKGGVCEQLLVQHLLAGLTQATVHKGCLASVFAGLNRAGCKQLAAAIAPLRVTIAWAR